MMDMGPIGRAEWSQLPLAKEETNWTGANDRNGEQNREDAGQRKMKQESGKEERKKRGRERNIEEIRREKLKRKQNQKG